MDIDANSNTSFREDLAKGSKLNVKKKQKKSDKKKHKKTHEKNAPHNASKKKSGHELRTYMEEIGFILALTSTIIELHQCKLKPEKPLDLFLRNFSTQSTPHSKLSRLMQKVELAKNEIVRLEKENSELRAKLEQFAPIDDEVLLGDPHCDCVCPRDDPALKERPTHSPTFRHRAKRDTKKPRILRLGCDFEGIKDSKNPSVASPITDSDKQSTL